MGHFILTNLNSTMKHFIFITAAFIALSVLSSCTDKDYDVVKSFPEEGEATLVMEIPYNPTEYFLSSITWTDGYWVYRLRDEPFLYCLTAISMKLPALAEKVMARMSFCHLCCQKSPPGLTQLTFVSMTGARDGFTTHP